jgi:ADP-heptose:LPS heptosyltransferase
VVRQQSVARSVSASSSVFFSGGLGDIFALEAFISDRARATLESICYATHKSGIIKQCFEALGNYPMLQKHLDIWTDFSSFWCFYSKAECDMKLRLAGTRKSHEFIKAADFSILQVFPKIRNGELRYNESSFVTETVASVEHFDLPKRFITICPYSSDKRLTDRDFSKEEWKAVTDFLEERDHFGVVLHDANEFVPSHPRLVDLSTKTTITEAVEILKASKGYIGIDSSLSVLAAKKFPAGRILIRSRNNHCWDNKSVYYAPHTEFTFLHRDLSFDHLTFNAYPTICTAQGLGDIFWVYQKLSPYFDKFNLGISILSTDKVSFRSFDWMKLFPKIVDVSPYMMSGDEYQKLSQTKWTVEEVLKLREEGEDEIDYCCNAWLEAGVNLYEIDDRPIEKTVPLHVEPFELPYKEFVTLYVSGATKNHGAVIQGAWNVDKWVDFVAKLYDRYELDIPVILIGADFDSSVMKEVESKLYSRFIQTTSFTQLEPAKVLHILKSTKLFIGYQSGLNIVADNFDTPQIMLYFPHLEKMMDTWCKPENVDTVFHAFLFSQTPDQIVDLLPYSPGRNIGRPSR